MSIRFTERIDRDGSAISRGIHIRYRRGPVRCLRSHYQLCWYVERLLLAYTYTGANPIKMLYDGYLIARRNPSSHVKFKVVRSYRLYFRTILIT